MPTIDANGAKHDNLGRYAEQNQPAAGFELSPATERFATRDEAIERVVVASLGDHADDYDVDAIAAEVLGDYEDGYAQTVTTDEFWQIAAKHDTSNTGGESDAPC